MAKILISLKNVYKTYMLGDTSFSALDGITLDIFEGELIAIVGKSGSGKSTLMHVIGLLDKPTNGEIYINDKLVSSMTDSALAKFRSETIGFVFQSFNLLARTSALDNVLLPTTYTKKNNGTPERARVLLERVGLADRLKNMPNQLSGGQQQRVAIARSMINDPAIILADEPTGNLDSKSSVEILKLLHDLHEEGKTIIIVTHDESIAKQAHRIIRILDGKIIEDTTNA